MKRISITLLVLFFLISSVNLFLYLKVAAGTRSLDQMEEEISQIQNSNSEFSEKNLDEKLDLLANEVNQIENDLNALRKKSFLELISSILPEDIDVLETISLSENNNFYQLSIRSSFESFGLLLSTIEKTLPIVMVDYLAVVVEKDYLSGQIKLSIPDESLKQGNKGTEELALGKIHTLFLVKEKEVVKVVKSVQNVIEKRTYPLLEDFEYTGSSRDESGIIYYFSDLNMGRSFKIYAETAKNGYIKIIEEREDVFVIEKEGVLYSVKK